uniref:Uncharacterized protein n=1 Tax=Leviviridae sp. TaxID=2027243 RepID=A0A514D453_9VIRU|nr:MAG: hypothetical protein H4BulkLitter2430083_000001 [Leviviridae sp.]
MCSQICRVVYIDTSDIYNLVDVYVYGDVERIRLIGNRAQYVEMRECYPVEETPDGIDILALDKWSAGLTIC